METGNPFKYYKNSAEIIRLAVMYYVRYPLSYRQVEDLLWERGIDVCHETVRYWVGVRGKKFAHSMCGIRQKSYSNWQWHSDEVFVKVKGKLHYVWRAVDGEGEVLDCFVSHRRDKKTAVWFLRKVMRKRVSRKDHNGRAFLV